LRDHCAKILIVCCLFFVTKLAHAQSIDKLYIQRCASCHGPEALGKPATSAPALAGQQAEYLERQLGHFVSGLRGRHKKDAYGAAMAPWALSLGEQSKPLTHQVWSGFRGGTSSANISTLLMAYEVQTSKISSAVKCS